MNSENVYSKIYSNSLSSESCEGPKGPELEFSILVQKDFILVKTNQSDIALKYKNQERVIEFCT